MFKDLHEGATWWWRRRQLLRPPHLLAQFRLYLLVPAMAAAALSPLCSFLKLLSGSLAC